MFAQFVLRSVILYLVLLGSNKHQLLLRLPLDSDIKPKQIKPHSDKSMGK